MRYKIITKVVILRIFIICYNSKISIKIQYKHSLFLYQYFLSCFSIYALFLFDVTYFEAGIQGNITGTLFTYY